MAAWKKANEEKLNAMRKAHYEAIEEAKVETWYDPTPIINRGRGGEQRDKYNS